MKSNIIIGVSIFISLIFIFCNNSEKLNDRSNLPKANELVLNPLLSFNDTCVFKIIREYVKYASSGNTRNLSSLKDKKNGGECLFYHLNFVTLNADSIILKIIGNNLTVNDLKWSPPTGYFMFEDNVFLVYTGLERLCKPDTFILHEIKTKFKDLIIDDSNLDHRGAFGSDLRTWEIVISRDTCCFQRGVRHFDSPYPKVVDIQPEK